jgi:hypothetical protein
MFCLRVFVTKLLVLARIDSEAIRFGYDCTREMGGGEAEAAVKICFCKKPSSR